MKESDPLDSWELESDQLGLLDASDSEVVAKFYSPLEADLAAAKLRSEGIVCFLANTASQHVQTQIMNMVRLHVRKADRDRAREILQDFLPEPESDSGSVWVGMLIILGIVAIIWLVGYAIRALLA
ncbi:MAG: DUF2007 domain-containing protein [Lewinellaceae bacterium]|nr:DUF2007 domain-containing protein [Lewinellaceae bacterium]